jgi:hypothetical protein
VTFVHLLVGSRRILAGHSYELSKSCGGEKRETWDQNFLSKKFLKSLFAKISSRKGLQPLIWMFFD